MANYQVKLVGTISFHLVPLDSFLLPPFVASPKRQCNSQPPNATDIADSPRTALLFSLAIDKEPNWTLWTPLLLLLLLLCRRNATHAHPHCSAANQQPKSIRTNRRPLNWPLLVCGEPN